MMIRLQKNAPRDNDFIIRDVFFKGSLPEEFDDPNLFYYARKHFSEEKSISSKLKYEKILKECKRKKYLFWKEHSSDPPKTMEVQATT